MIDLSSERAARGAAMLDREIPGWYEHIDLGRLSLESWELDIAGQLWERLGVKVYELCPPDRDITTFCGEHGFNSMSRGDETSTYAGLDAAWKREIAERLAAKEAA